MRLAYRFCTEQKPSHIDVELLVHRDQRFDRDTPLSLFIAVVGAMRNADSFGYRRLRQTDLAPGNRKASPHGDENIRCLSRHARFPVDHSAMLSNHRTK